MGAPRGRRRLAAGIALALGALLALTPLNPGAVPSASAADSPARPFGSHPVPRASGAASPPGGVSAADSATAAAYDAWKSRYLKAGCGDGRYYVDASTATKYLVVSEGQGYGMVVTALMAGHDPKARAYFDGLYRYVLDHPSSGDPQLMAWHQLKDCSDEPGSDSSASDGDLDIAYALLLADTQWGSAGAVDYAGEARRVIAAIKRSAMSPDTALPLLGDWVGPDSDYRDGVRTSDLMVGHFRAFQAATGDPYWGEAATAALDLVETLQRTAAADTGLLPDFAIRTGTTPVPAPPKYLESVNDGTFGYNACRTPWRLASSALLAGDTRAAAAAGRMAGWAVGATKGDPALLRAGYQLDGTPTADFSDVAFLAPMVAGAAVSSSRQSWVNAGWPQLVTAGTAGYYSDTLRLQAMLLVSNNAWQPTTRAPAGVHRIGGADRFVVSAAISAASFPRGTPTVYVASGENFPDALSASAAAGAFGGPVLLVRRDSLPPDVLNELTRLEPDRIVLLGGPNSVGAAVERALAAVAPVTRIGGADRFEVSARVSAAAFPRGAGTVYVASGETFPDALAGSAAAGHDRGPVLLVRRDGVPTPIGIELRRLQPTSIVLLGGPNAVSETTKAALATIAPVSRVSGADRFAVAASLSARVFPAPGTSTVYVASGATFPDALSGSAAAIAVGAPVLLVTRDAIPAAIAAELKRLKPARIVVLGGTAPVSSATEAALRAYLAPSG
ncbi:glycosyl hydrolase family 8 [Herbiconiux sp. CPCC 205716]|uniref:Glucanase n=1 Tax=Herbiconiux gentiana TaxID=2970912 RepID=A0ABT2GIN7_9MICO|nr:glycosyl hydrolase family 8 [Herbiconiux gentiana]MCS5714739.1 glycosyl hydrolase family 8 [Herbiconiux gentiana]